MADAYESDNHSDNEQADRQQPLPPRRDSAKPPRARPESTMALDFSEALDGAFNLGGELGELTDSVAQKKANVSSQSRQLEELEARLKAAEERLKKASGTNTPQAGVGEQEQQYPKQLPSAGPASLSPAAAAVPGGPPRRAAPTRADAIAASSVADRVPTPMDPSRSGKPLPRAPHPAAYARPDA